MGVTGTNGKTTTATLLYEMFRLFGYKVGLLSTVCNYIDDIAVPATHTTPDPLHLHRLLREMVDAGCAYAFMEVSSHSAAQHRIAGLDFNGAIFTNLTRDHIDYHKTVEAYLKAKKSFFDNFLRFLSSYLSMDINVQVKRFAKFSPKKSKTHRHMPDGSDHTAIQLTISRCFLSQ